MTRTWHFYDPATGIFIQRRFRGPPDAIEINTPAGLVAWEGDVDPLSQRMDIASGEIIDWRPPRPGQDHEWDADARRWLISEQERVADLDRGRILGSIQQVESRQHRAVREAALGMAGAQARLEALDAEIVALRAELSKA